MAPFPYLSLFLFPICLFVTLSSAADPFAFYDFEVSYITASPLGVPQQVYFPSIFFHSAIFYAMLLFFLFWILSLAAWEMGSCWILRMFGFLALQS